MLLLLCVCVSVMLILLWSNKAYFFSWSSELISYPVFLLWKMISTRTLHISEKCFLRRCSSCGYKSANTGRLSICFYSKAEQTALKALGVWDEYADQMINRIVILSSSSLHSDGVHRGGHPVLPVGLTDGQPAKLSSVQLTFDFQRHSIPKHT